MISLGVILLVFWPTLQSFHGVWTRYTYSHGYLIPPLVLWLAWRRRSALLEAESGAREALALLAVLGLGWFVAVVANVQVVHQAFFPLILLAWVTAVAGWQAARRLLPAAVVFFFAVPFWEEILTRPLQRLTIVVNEALVRAMGIPAEITGEYVVIPSGVFEIADSCSGLNFFIIGLLLGVLYAHLFVTRWRTRIQIIVAAVALAIVANWIRVTGLVVIGHATEMQWRYIEDHGTYGWVIFAVAIAIFFLVAEFLRKRGDVVGAPERAASDDDPAAVWPSSAPLRTRVALATTVAIGAPLVYLGLLVAPTATLAEPSEAVGGEGWTESPTTAAPPRGWEPEFPTADVRRASVWTDGATEIHQLTLLYESQEQGRELVGSGNRIAAGRALAGDGVLWIPRTDLWVREAFVRTPDGPVVVWYWYRIGGVRAVSPIKAKALEVLAFLRRRPQGALVTLSVPCVSEQCQDEREILRAFVSGE